MLGVLHGLCGMDRVRRSIGSLSSITGSIPTEFGLATLLTKLFALAIRLEDVAAQTQVSLHVHRAAPHQIFAKCNPLTYALHRRCVLCDH